MAEQDDKSAAMVKTGDQSSIGAGCAPGEERDSAIGICAVHSPTVTAAIAEFCGPREVTRLPQREGRDHSSGPRGKPEPLG